MNDQVISIDGLSQLSEKAWAIYEKKLKKKLESEFMGQVIAIEVESEDWFLGETVVEALLKARQKYPDKLFHVIRIGHRAVYKRR